MVVVLVFFAIFQGHLLGGLKRTGSSSTDCTFPMKQHFVCVWNSQQAEFSCTGR